MFGQWARNTFLIGPEPRVGSGLLPSGNYLSSPRSDCPAPHAPTESSDLVQYLQPIPFLLCQQQLLLFFGHLSEWLTQQELSTLPIQEFLTLLRHSTKP